MIDNNNVKRMFSARFNELLDESAYSSFRDFCLKNNLRYQTLKRYADGERMAPSDTLREIATIFKVSTDYLCGISNDRLPSNLNAIFEMLSEDGRNELINYGRYLLAKGGENYE